MLMYDCLKKEVKSEIVIHFIENIKTPEKIEISQFQKYVPKDSKEVKISFCDKSINEYKLYDCKTTFSESLQVINSMSLYYNKTNYFYSGDGKNSAEIIFSDFMNKSIRKEDCVIEYDGIKYTPLEDFDLFTRKRINFINIDITKLKLPKDLEGKDVILDTKNYNNFLISISVVNNPKVISVNENSPFKEKKFEFTEKELINILKSPLDKIKKYVYFNNNESYMDYSARLTNQVSRIYAEEIFNSQDIETKVFDYFSIPRDVLNEEQIILYDLYSEYLIYFPNFMIDYSKIDVLNGRKYYYQYFYSKSSINNFYKTITTNISESDKVKLKYSACRCLSTLLNHGNGSCFTELFQFIDFTKPDTIYYDANKYNRDFVESLTEKSEIFLFFLQINSGSSINLLTNELTSRISMLSDKDIKNHLLSTIPNYGIKILVKADFNACTFIETKITCIHEFNILGRFLTDSKTLSENDYDYCYRFLLANLMQHENFGHVNFSINFFSFYDKNIKRQPQLHFSEVLSPFKYYIIKEKKEEMQEIVKEVKVKKNINNRIKKNSNDEIILKGESGIALAFFLTRGKYRLMKLLRRQGINFMELFKNPSLQATNDLTEYINKLEQLYSTYYELFMYDNDNNVEYRTRFEDSRDENKAPVIAFPTLERINTNI